MYPRCANSRQHIHVHWQRMSVRLRTTYIAPRAVRYDMSAPRLQPACAARNLIVITLMRIREGRRYLQLLVRRCRTYDDASDRVDDVDVLQN